MDVEAERIIRDLRVQVDQPREEIVRLKGPLEEARRAVARPATPFRRPESK